MQAEIARLAFVRSFSEMVDATSGDKLQELVPWLIERVETADRRVIRIVPTEPARPFFAWAEQRSEEQECAHLAPPDGAGDLPPHIAGLDWYAA